MAVRRTAGRSAAGARWATGSPRCRRLARRTRRISPTAAAPLTAPAAAAAQADPRGCAASGSSRRPNGVSWPGKSGCTETTSIGRPSITSRCVAPSGVSISTGCAGQTNCPSSRARSRKRTRCTQRPSSFSVGSTSLPRIQKPGTESGGTTGRRTCSGGVVTTTSRLATSPARMRPGSSARMPRMPGATEATAAAAGSGRSAAAPIARSHARPASAARRLTSRARDGWKVGSRRHSRRLRGRLTAPARDGCEVGSLCQLATAARSAHCASSRRPMRRRK